MVCVFLDKSLHTMITHDVRTFVCVAIVRVICKRGV